MGVASSGLRTSTMESSLCLLRVSARLLARAPSGTTAVIGPCGWMLSAMPAVSKPALLRAKTRPWPTGRPWQKQAIWTRSSNESKSSATRAPAPQSRERRTTKSPAMEAVWPMTALVPVGVRPALYAMTVLPAARALATLRTSLRPSPSLRPSR